MSTKLDTKASTRYAVECIGRNGEMKWREEFSNLVTKAGLAKLLDACFARGSAEPAWSVGLVAGPSPSYSANDTMASHAGWSEFTDFSDETRQAFTPGAIADGSVDNTAARAVYHINGSGSVAGCFLADDAASGGSDGTLYGEGNFAGGARTVEDGDILKISITLTVAAA